MKQREYRKDGVARETRIDPAPEIAREMADTYGNLRAGAGVAVEFWPLVRGSFAHLTDPEQGSFNDGELAEMESLMVSTPKLTRDAVAILDQRFSKKYGKRFSDLAEVERMLIIDACWVRSRRRT